VPVGDSYETVAGAGRRFGLVLSVLRGTGSFEGVDDAGDGFNCWD